MRIHLSEGRVRVECPECEHWQEVTEPRGEVICQKCKLAIRYETGYSDNQFLQFRVQARQRPNHYRRVG